MRIFELYWVIAAAKIKKWEQYQNNPDQQNANSTIAIERWSLRQIKLTWEQLKAFELYVPRYESSLELQQTEQKSRYIPKINISDGLYK